VPGWYVHFFERIEFVRAVDFDVRDMFGGEGYVEEVVFVGV
jgi:hypothetical protein